MGFGLARPNNKTALILGVNGPDGSYLVELLQRRGYKVIGIGRQDSYKYSNSLPYFSYVQMDLSGPPQVLIDFLSSNTVDVVFHMAAINGASDFQFETVWADMVAVNITSLHTILEYSRIHQPGLRLLYAGSAKIYAPRPVGVVDENGPFSPACLYGIGKFTSFKLINYYRSVHNILAGNLILFHHESRRRPAHYFIPTIANCIASAIGNPEAKVTVRTLDFYADWGGAEEFMDISIDISERAPGMDFAMASGVTWLARSLVDAAFKRHNLDYRNHVIELQPQQDAGPSFQVVISRMEEQIGRRPETNILDIIDSIISDTLLAS